MRLLVILIITCAWIPCALAHSGGLNAEGCHNNRKTGDYHCHKAKAARREPIALRESGQAGPRDCGTKTYCREMTSCEEARHFLLDCGLTRLDRDNDGIPCEELC